MSGILEGIRVIDWTVAQAGPYAGQMLGDLGADVIHIEGPNRPEPTRNTITAYDMPVMLPKVDWSVFYEDHNRNKRAITLDANKPEGRQVAYELVKNADVFLSNYRLKALEKMGLDYPSLSKVNKRLIYATGSGMGRNGPDADRPCMDLVANARSSWMMAAGEQGQGPSMVPVGVGDRIVSVFLSYGILAALLRRQKTGEGQELHVSQLGAMMNLMGNTISSRLWMGKAFPRFDHESARNPLFNYYCCKDGKWIAMSEWMSDQKWGVFCKVTDLGRLEHDPRFVNSEKRSENRHELLKILVDTFAGKTSREWDQTLSKGDLMFATVQDVDDVVNDPQVIANKYIFEWDHPIRGKVPIMGFPVEFSADPCTVRLAPPAMGQHTEEVLQEYLGYSWEKLSELREKGII